MTLSEIIAHQIEDDTVPVTDSHHLAGRLERLISDRAALIELLKSALTHNAELAAKIEHMELEESVRRAALVGKKS